MDFKLVNKWIISLILFFFSIFNTTIQAQVMTRIDSVMAMAASRGIFNGNLLIAKGNAVVYQKSFGFSDGKRKTLLTPHYKFDIGSVSKEFNGVGIMILKEKGLLNLDSSLFYFFPEFSDWAKKVKIKHLINYTSGIPKLSGNSPNGSDSLLYKDLTRLQKLDFEPGSQYDYNYVNVFLQQRLIERVSKLSYATFLKNNIVDPLKMHQTAVDYPVTSADMAQAFGEDDAGTPYTNKFKGWTRLTISDLFTWENALWSEKLISHESLLMLAGTFATGETSLGRVKQLDGKFILHTHQGSNFNYEAMIYHSFADSITILMMTNQQQMKVQALAACLHQALKNERCTVPKKSLYLSIRDKVLQDVEKGLAYYQKLKMQDAEAYDFSVELPDLLNTGKYLHRRSRFKEAIQVYKTAVLLEGKKDDLSYGYELMGDAYLESGDKINSRKSYQKAIDLDPDNKNAKGKIQLLN